MQQLRPTVKRDLSLFSVKSWQHGYLESLPVKLEWSYPIIFHYDGQRVNFYHLASDFQHFKSVVTARLLKDDILFDQLNADFLEDVARLQLKLGKLQAKDLAELSVLIGKIMSFYIFVVSDSFVEARPAAWPSRHASEGILYQIDIEVEQITERLLKELKLPIELAHVLLPNELVDLASGRELNVRDIEQRLLGYTIWEDRLITGRPFDNVCVEYGWINPEDEVKNDKIDEVRGAVGFQGRVEGRAVIVRNRGDLDLVQQGDVIVSVMTNVNYLPAFKRAVAIVTDEGGVTCHAAILSRELGKPCVIGTKIATQVFKTGEMVSVDAIGGTVRRM